MPRLAHRVLLIVIDGLRADTAFSSGCMPRLQALATEQTSGIALATPITMTGVGIKALGGGVSSGLWSIARNWDQPHATFDNLFDALRARGGHFALVGNPTWAALYGPATEHDSRRSRMSDLFHLIDPVYGDDLVWARYAKRVVATDTGQWDLAVVHLGGIDNASHIWTPSSPRFCEKATQMDRDVVTIAEAAGPNTTTIITSDHGTGDRGHHGSGEPEARRTPIVLFGPGIRHAQSIEVDQLDIAPTIAVLLGLPIPAPVEGRPLTELLAISLAQRQLLDAASLRQQQTYADAYASAWRLASPQLTQPGQLGPWLAETRSGSGLVPLALAMMLGGLALLWLFASTEWPASSSLTRRELAIALGALLLLELAVGAWRLHSRAVQLFVLARLSAAGSAHGLVVWTLAIVVGVAATPLLRRIQARASSRAVVGLTLFALAALGDTLAIVVAVTVIVAVLGVIGTRRTQLVGAGLLLLGEVLMHVARQAPIGVLSMVATLSPLLVAAFVLPHVSRDHRKRRALIVLFIAAIASALKAGFLPEQLIHPFLALSVLALMTVGVFATRDRLITLAGVALIGLALLTEPAQAIGFVVLVACLSVVAGAFTATDTEASPVLLPVLALAYSRLLFIRVFEGEFSFSRLEIHLGYLANPGQDHALGAATIITKLCLPMFVGVLMLLAPLSPRRRATIVLGALAFFTLRLVHIALSMVVARGTFYSPYADAGQLLFHVVFVLSLLLLRRLSA